MIGKTEPEKVKVRLKFNYGFLTRHENIVRLLKTDNYVLGLLFADWFEDPRLNFNGTEWSSFFYFNTIIQQSEGFYKKEEYEKAQDQRVINQV